MTESVASVRRCSDGRDRAALDAWVKLCYSELHALAHRRLSGESASQNACGDLVHETYLRLAGSSVAWRDRGHFLAVAARTMRRVLIDEARARRAGKRQGPSPSASPRSWEARAAGDPRRVRRALAELRRRDRRQALVIALLFYWGFSLAEAAAITATSHATVRRRWRGARAWLAGELLETSGA